MKTLPEKIDLFSVRSTFKASRVSEGRYYERGEQSGGPGNNVYINFILNDRCAA